MRGDRSAQALIGRGGRNLVDEALARSAEEKGQAEGLKLTDACDRGEALLRRFAEADARIEHDVLPRDAGVRGNLQRAAKERGYICHDVDRRIGRLAVVHDDHRHRRLGYYPRKLALALQAPDV